MYFPRNVHISVGSVFKVDFLGVEFGFASLLGGYNTPLTDSPRKDIKCVVILLLSQRWVEPRARGEGKWAKDCGSKRELAGSDPVTFKGHPLPNRANLQEEIMQSSRFPAPLKTCHLYPFRFED